MIIGTIIGVEVQDSKLIVKIRSRNRQEISNSEFKLQYINPILKIGCKI